MPDKRPYSTPQLFQVDLNMEQAILTTCSDGTNSLAGNGNARCIPISSGAPSGCKSSSSSQGVGNFSARAS
jgi:hypothetical protein